jgi:hypothetical protein
MEVIAFGRRVVDLAHQTYDELSHLLSALPRRFKPCEIEIVMRGSSADFDDWVALRVSTNMPDVERACVEWNSQQMTRRGFALLPRAFP